MRVVVDDHDVFAASIKRLSNLPCSPVKASRRAATYCANTLRSTANSSKVNELKKLLDAAGSTVGIPPLPSSPSPTKRLRRKPAAFPMGAKQLPPLQTAAGHPAEPQAQSDLVVPELFSLKGAKSLGGAGSAATSSAPTAAAAGAKRKSMAKPGALAAASASAAPPPAPPPRRTDSSSSSCLLYTSPSPRDS